jgi:hypothetical protein
LILLTGRAFCRHDSFGQRVRGVDQTEASAAVSDEKESVGGFGSNAMERRFRNAFSFFRCIGGAYPEKWCLVLPCLVLVKRVGNQQTDRQIGR